MPISEIQQPFMNGGVFAGAILGGWLTQILASQTYQIAPQQIQGITLPFWIAGALGILTTILFMLYVEEPDERKLLRILFSNTSHNKTYFDTLFQNS